MSEYDTVWAFRECEKLVSELELDLQVKDYPVPPNEAYLELGGLLVPEGMTFNKVGALYEFLLGLQFASKFYLNA